MARGRGASAEKRTKALEQGLLTYVGKPCRHGHDGTRYSSCRACVACQEASRKPGRNKPEYWRKWDAKNPAKRYSLVRTWMANNPAKVKGYRKVGGQVRRARKNNAPGGFTTEETDLLLAQQDYRCAYCSAEHRLSLDHKTPLSRGGSNWIENLQWLCVSCNSKKRTRTDEEYRALVGIPLETR